MLRASDLLPKTCSKLIGRAAKAGLVERKKQGRNYYDRLITPRTSSRVAYPCVYAPGRTGRRIDRAPAPVYGP
jgi:hypothetical protein